MCVHLVSTIYPISFAKKTLQTVKTKGQTLADVFRMRVFFKRATAL